MKLGDLDPQLYMLRGLLHLAADVLLVHHL